MKTTTQRTLEEKKMQSVKTYLASVAKKTRCFVCTVASSPLPSGFVKVEEIDGSGSLVTAALPSMTPREERVLRDEANETSASETSKLVRIEGYPPIVLLHESYNKGEAADGSDKKATERELIHELEHLNDHGGQIIFDGVSFQGSIHHTVLNALKDVKCEGQCIKCGLAKPIRDDLREYARLIGSNFKPLSEENPSGVSSAIGGLLSRYIRLSFLRLGGTDLEFQRQGLEKLKSTLVEISSDRVSFRGVFLNIRREWNIREDVKTLLTPYGYWPSEDPDDIVASVNTVVQKIVFWKPPRPFPSMVFREKEDECEFAVTP